MEPATDALSRTAFFRRDCRTPSLLAAGVMSLAKAAA